MTDLEVLQFIALKMFYCVACGAVVGFERRLNSAPAGFKTQILVCVGAMLFSVYPTIAGEMMKNETPRVIGQIVSGVGFLGAGAIMHNSRSVSGLTTAAWIWFTASIGIMVGLGHGLVAMFTTVTLTSVICFFRFIEKKYFSSQHSFRDLKDNVKEDDEAKIRKAS